MKYNMPKRYRVILIACLILVMSLIMTLTTSCGWAEWNDQASSFKGNIVGRSFECQFFDNSGEQFMTAHGEKINMSANYIREYSYGSEGSSYTDVVSSVVTITIDGSQVESCGSTILFIEDGLTSDVDFNSDDVRNIQSSADEFSDNTFIANIVNEFKNSFGKSVVVVIQSQLGDPICAFSGEDVYWAVCEDLPKTTRLMIDGKALYIHRANFQIIDKDLLD